MMFIKISYDSLDLECVGVDFKITRNPAQQEILFKDTLTHVLFNTKAH